MTAPGTSRPDGGGVMRSASARSSTAAPTFRSSVAIAARRSVSLTRQLPTLRMTDGPSANSASTAAVIAASGMWLRSRSIGRSGRAPRTSIQSSPSATAAPIARSTSTKRTSPCTLARPTPCTRTGPPPSAPAARKYDADDASPSTWIVPGLR